MIQLSDEAIKYLKAKHMGINYFVITPTKLVKIWQYEGVLYVDKEEDAKAISEMSFLKMNENKHEIEKLLGGHYEDERA